MLNSKHTLYRHRNGMGTVIVFDMYGTEMVMFVPDAKYRPTRHVEWGGYKTDVSGITNITNSSFFIMGVSSGPKLPLSTVPTDTELQTMLALDSIQTAKECTDAIISTLGSDTNHAAGLARSVSIDGLGAMDLPNIYELMILWREADSIDIMDPTAKDYPAAKIGYTHSKGRFRDYCAWSSSEYSSDYAWRVDYYGYASYSYKDSHRYVVPVLEL